MANKRTIKVMFEELFKLLYLCGVHSVEADHAARKLWEYKHGK